MARTPHRTALPVEARAQFRWPVYPPATSRNARKIRQSASLISNSGCHWTPRQKRRRGQLAVAAAVLGPHGRGPRRLTEHRRDDMGAATGDNQAVDPDGIGGGGLGVVREEDRQPAGPAHRGALIIADRIPQKIRIS